MTTSMSGIFPREWLSRQDVYVGVLEVAITNKDAEDLRTARARADLSIEQLAARVGIPPSQLHDIESGKPSAAPSRSLYSQLLGICLSTPALRDNRQEPDPKAVASKRGGVDKMLRLVSGKK